jgi:Na+/H+-dicarboxylate symporter
MSRLIVIIAAIGNGKMEQKARAKRLIVFICGTAIAILIAGAMSLILSHPAAATPEFTKQTGKPCGQCHESPAGGKLKPYGEEFKANGFKLPGK